MAQARYVRTAPSFSSDLDQTTPISSKTPRITQGAPEKIGVKPFGIIESYGKQPNTCIIINLLGGSNLTFCFQ
jgi:hypothetical protein